MGHFHSGKYCREISKRFYRYGRVTIKEIVDDFRERKFWMSCSEGELEERETISMGVEMIFGIWDNTHSAIEPVPELLSDEQRQVLREWRDEDEERDSGYWDERDYGLFDTIYWQRKKGFFAAGGLPIYGEITT